LSGTFLYSLHSFCTRWYVLSIAHFCRIACIAAGAARWLRRPRAGR
jgi:hypothetical protein